MERGLTALLGLILGLLLAMGVYALFVDGGASGPVAPDTSFPAVEHDPEAATGLVAAWRRWRTASFVTEGTWQRALDGIDEPLTGPVYTAQDPPRRLVVRLGSTVEEIDSLVATCDSSDDEIIAPACLAGDAGLGYDERVDAELRLVEDYVSGPGRLYSIERAGPGCYRAELDVFAAASPWGRWAEFCFDPASGALSSARIRRQSAVDTELVHSIRTEVSESDFG